MTLAGGSTINYAGILVVEDSNEREEGNTFPTISIRVTFRVGSPKIIFECLPHG
jgi:hypothetical protein